MENRIGIIEVSNNLLKEISEDTNKINFLFKDFLILETNNNDYTTEYTCFNKNFRELKKDEQIPKYIIIISTKQNGKFMERRIEEIKK